jgi:hypothetical protein
MAAGFYLALFYQDRRFQAQDVASLEAIYFILLELALIVGVALLFSCISSLTLSAVLTFCIFIIGNLLADIRWFGSETHSTLVSAITTFLYYLLPNFSLFNVIGSAAHGDRIPGHLLISRSLYALLYAAILVSASILIFEERELQ